MKKTLKYISYIVIIALILIESFLVLKKELQNDTFYSIKVGDYLIHNGISSLNIDKLSWHKNLSYCNPHWLNDVAIYLSYAIGGLSGIGNYVGVYLLTLIETFALAILIFYISYKESKNRWVSCIITLFIMCLMKSFLSARAQLVSYILFVLEVYFIEKYIKDNKKRYVVRTLDYCISFG